MTNYFFIIVNSTNQVITSNIYDYENDTVATRDLVRGVQTVVETMGDELSTFDIYKICGNTTERIHHEQI